MKEGYMLSVNIFSLGSHKRVGFPPGPPEQNCVKNGINGRLAILKNLKCLQLRKELNYRKDRVKMSMCSFRVIVSFDEKLRAFAIEFWLKQLKLPKITHFVVLGNLVTFLLTKQKKKNKKTKAERRFMNMVYTDVRAPDIT